MEQNEQYKPQIPIFLKLLMGIGVVFFGALGLLMLSMILSMFGFAYGMQDLVLATVIMERIGIGLLGLSIVLGGAVSIAGLTVKSFTSTNTAPLQSDKQKNEDQIYDIRDYGLTVEDVLDELSMQERELLAEKLAESRLAIREDGTLIPLEQAQKLYKVERFIDG